MGRLAQGLGSVGVWGRRLLLQLAIAWAALHLLLYQSTMVRDAALQETPVETALRRAGVQVEEVEFTLLWNRPPGPALPGTPGDFYYLEGRVHHWMATLGRALGIPRWRVMERREGHPYLLGLGGESGGTAAGITAARQGGGEAPPPLRVEVWLYGPEVPVAGLPVAPKGGLIVRLRAAGAAPWTERFIQEWLPAFPPEWKSGEAPQLLVRWRVHWDGDQEAGLERLFQALSARVVERRGDRGRQEVWLASPRGSLLPGWALPPSRAPGANLYVTWGGTGPSSDGWAARAAAPVAPGEKGRGRAELLAVPHPLSALGKAWLGLWGAPPGGRRTSGTHTGGNFWTG